MDQIELNLNEETEISFSVKIESSINARPKFRLICENVGMGYSFNGTSDGENVKFTIPSLKNFLREGEYPMRLEVVIDDKLFVPMEFNTKFIKPVTVTVESVNVPVAKKKEEQVKPVAKLIGTKLVPTLDDIYRKQIKKPKSPSSSR